MIVIVTDLVARYTPPTPTRTPWIILSNSAASWRRRGGRRTGAARRLDEEELLTVMVSFGLFLVTCTLLRPRSASPAFREQDSPT